MNINGNVYLIVLNKYIMAQIEVTMGILRNLVIILYHAKKTGSCGVDVLILVDCVTVVTLFKHINRICQWGAITEYVLGECSQLGVPLIDFISA